MTGGGGSSDHSGSVFRVGDNVEFVRVLGMVSLLVFCIMVGERALHKLEHALHKYPKYHEMMTKVFGELMILGLIGLGIKILKELDQLDAYSKRMIAFQAADITVFLVAIALILQALVVFLRLRRKNIQADIAELVATQHLVDRLARTPSPSWFHEFSALFTCVRRGRAEQQQLTTADLPEIAQLRILRHYFLESYGLPELFPFSKYLRQAQDNQISHMIEVEISTWMMLLLVAWALGSVAQIVDHKYHTPYAIVVAFLIFSWASVLFHIAITAYFTWAIDELVRAAVHAPAHGTSRYVYLNEIAEQEAQAADREFASDAIATMERVREHEQMKRVKRKRNMLSEHDTGFQLLGTVFRKLQGSTRRRGDTSKSRDVEERADEVEPAAPTQGPTIQLRWFSRKAWHFVIMSTLMLNALYVALFCQCVIYRMTSIYHQYGALTMCFIPLPLVINMLAFQPRILRNFILVSSIFRVDDTALGDVIDHFTETVQLRAGFVQSVHSYLEATDQTVADIQSEFEARDTTKTGLLDSEEVRRVLYRFGFKLTFFRFNSVAKLLFDLHGINIEYAQVVRLLEIGQTDDVRVFTNSTTFVGGAGSMDQSFMLRSSVKGALPVLETSYTTSPYVSGTASSQTPLESKPRSHPVLLRAKSSAANSLYRLNTSTEDWFPSQVTSPHSNAQYVRM